MATNVFHCIHASEQEDRAVLYPFWPLCDKGKRLNVSGETNTRNKERAKSHTLLLIMIFRPYNSQRVKEERTNL